MDRLTFIDPTTGITFRVAPTRATVELAERLGYIPYDEASEDEASRILFGGRDA